MKIQKQIDVRMVKKGPVSSLRLVQYDTGVQLLFNVLDWTIPSNTKATLYVRKRSGKFVYQEKGVTVSENTVTVDLENQALTEHGETFYQLRFMNGADVISTFSSAMFVERSLADSDAVESTTVVAAFEAKTAEQLAKIEAETLEQIAVLQAASQTEQEAIENKGLEVLNTIPADYTATAALAEKLNREKGSAIVCEAEGEVITVADSSDDYVRGLKLFGKTEQAKTNGYQIFDISRFPDFTAGGTTVVNNADGTKTVSNGGVTMLVNPDGTMKISGSGEVTALYSARFDYTHEETIKLLKAGKLYCNFGAVTVPKLFIQINNESGTLASMNNEYSTIASVDITQEMLNDEGVFLRCSFYQVNGTIVPNTVKPMLYQDGDGTFEPFSGGAPSPSPDYPQELESVGAGGAIRVTVAGKNLLPPDVLNASAYTEGGYGDAYPTVYKLPMIKAGNTYTLSFDFVKCDAYYFLQQYDSSSGNIEVFKYLIVASYNGGKVECTFTAEKGKEYYLYGNNTEFLETALANISNFQLELGSTATAYEPYKGQTLAASTPNGLPGIPVTSGGNYTDENGQQWICDEIDFGRGVYVQRIGLVDIGTLDWGYSTSGSTRFQSISLVSQIRRFTASEKANIMCTNYVTGTASQVYGGLVGISSMDTNVWICDPSYTDVATFKSAMSGVMLLYELATPTETPLTAEELAQYAALHSNKPNTTAFNDSGAHMALEYNADSKTYIDNKFAELAAAIVNNA